MTKTITTPGCPMYESIVWGVKRALVGDKVITANMGENVRLYFGNGGPNLVSSFPVIGEIFDKVWAEGGIKVS